MPPSWVARLYTFGCTLLVVFSITVLLKNLSYQVRVQLPFRNIYYGRLPLSFKETQSTALLPQKIIFRIFLKIKKKRWKRNKRLKKISQKRKQKIEKSEEASARACQSLFLSSWVYHYCHSWHLTIASFDFEYGISIWKHPGFQCQWDCKGTPFSVS